MFFGFWLTHVPPARFDAFWQLVADALVPGGRFFLLDNLYSEGSSTTGQTVDRSGVAKRHLNDGRVFHIVKVYYEPADLGERLATLGWDASITSTDEFFIHGWGRRAG